MFIEKTRVVEFSNIKNLSQEEKIRDSLDLLDLFTQPNRQFPGTGDLVIQFDKKKMVIH